MSQKRVAQLLFNIEALHFEQVHESMILVLTIDSTLNWKANL